MRILKAQPGAIWCCVALFILSAAGLNADPIAYDVTQQGLLGTIDLATGLITPIGYLGVEPGGLAVAGGSLFASENPYSDPNGLYRVNPADGSGTLVGYPGAYWDWGGFGSTLSGLYSVGASGLFSIDPLTGAATDIGPTGVGAGRVLSTNSDTLYLAQGFNLFTLDTGTGQATLIGAFGDSVQIQAMVMEGGILYGVDGSHTTIDTIDTTTGLATVFSNIVGPQSPWGLAPYPVPAGPSVPEPGSAFLLTAGVAGLIAAKRKMRNPRT
jgi:hypothetical protein